jgi:hypothetical protein
MSKPTEQKVFPFLPILALIFITLKLTGYITWSWLWVLSPLWIPIAIVIWLFIVAFIGMILADLLSRK